MLRWIRPSRGSSRPRRASHDRRRARLWVEPLETRALLSASAVLHTLDLSNDPYYTSGYLWGMYGDTSPLRTNQYGSQAAEAWANGYTGSKSVYVGIVDEGLQVAHSDLKANVWQNPFDPVDGVDNDHNGYVDDTNGWDFVSNNRTVYDGGYYGTRDKHGTHVAGTIGAVGGNGTGVAGVDWNVTLISAKFLGPYGGTIANAVKAIDYLTDLKTRHGLNIVAINASWGGGGYSSALHSAIIRAAKAGILFVAAAGNSGLNNDTSAFYPANYNTTVGTATETAASYDSVISVAAITSSGGLAYFSDYGPTTVDLGAPGVSITSTLPNNTYGTYSGTSMAAPHVTGAAALFAAAHPGATAAEIKSAILSSVTPTASLQGKTVTGGRLNVAALLETSPAGATSSGSSSSGGSSSGGTSPAAQGTGDATTDNPSQVAVFFVALETVVPMRPLVVSAPLVTLPVPPPPVFVPSGEREPPILQRVVGGVGEGVRDEELRADEAPRAPAEPQAIPQAPAGMGATAKESAFLAWGRVWDTVFTSSEPARQGESEEVPLALVGSDAGTLAPLGAAAGLVLALGGGWADPASASEPERRRRRRNA